jgi:hypothetical protein
MLPGLRKDLRCAAKRSPLEATLPAVLPRREAVFGQVLPGMPLQIGLRPHPWEVPLLLRDGHPASAAGEESPAANATGYANVAANATRTAATRNTGAAVTPPTRRALRMAGPDRRGRRNPAKDENASTTAMATAATDRLNSSAENKRKERGAPNS